MQDIFFVVLIFAPLVFFLWLANLAERRRVEGQTQSALGIVTLVLVGLFYALFLMCGAPLQIVGLLTQGPDAGALADALAAGPFDAGALARMGLAMWVSALLGILLLLPPLRRLLARVISFDPANTVHAVALSYTALILMNLLVTLGLGLRNLAELMETAAPGYNPAPGVWAQDITWAFMALVGVGWLSRQGLRGALRRLGITAPSLLQVGGGLGIGLLLVPVVLAVEWATQQAGIPSNTDVERLTEQMVGPLARSLPGILTLGLAAALGEESIFRGAFQPRFGLWFATLLFALMHSNYGISISTLLVTIVGLVLGLVRIRANTSTAMIVHAVYNMSLGLLSYLGWLQNL